MKYEKAEEVMKLMMKTAEQEINDEEQGMNVEKAEEGVNYEKAEKRNNDEKS